MIFVSVGTNEARFERLLRAVAGLPIDELVVVQHGHTPPIHPPGAEVVDFLPFERMVDRVRAARVVVTHAGVGSIMVALAGGRRPVVMPRRKELGEAVDGHQFQLGRRFAEAGLVTLVESAAELGAALAGDHAAPAVTVGSSELAADLRAFVEETTGRPVPAGAAA